MTSGNNKATQPWISNPVFDWLFILFPPFGCLLFIILFPSLFVDSKEMPEAWWVILILLVDVAHVYSTLYRTYFDRETFTKQRTSLLTIPFIGFVAAVLLFSISSLLFWRVLAYVAVYHFIRQQYGFMRLYSRKENVSSYFKTIDTIAIYAATIYPIIHWHTGGTRNFNWFVAGDFIYYRSDVILLICSIAYYLVIATYLIKEIVFSIKTKSINIPRVAIITGTIVSWYFGIVYFNGDMAYTLLNVVSHGIPYMALIWIYGKRKHSTSISNSSIIMKHTFSKYGLIVFLAIIFLLAFVEEGLWDMALWKEHKNIFSGFHFTNIQLNKELLSFIVPLLALPQITHYIIDGFIWKIKKDKSLQ